MPPILKDIDLSSSETSTARAANSATPQTVALEVPVTVNGVRPVEHSDKREPFAEATKTVLVHSAGAVIRLASAVVPGQLLFLTNDKTKKEVVCQVVKSKSHGNVNGYVELEFTEPVQGFWGLGFPAERAAGSSAATRPPVLSPLGQNMELRPPVSDGLTKSTDPSTSVSTDDFKTEIKPDSRPMNKADFLAPTESSTQVPTIETSRLQEQLSSLLSAEPAADDAPRPVSKPTSGSEALSDATAKIFEIAAKEPAPKAPVSTAPAFDAEEVKIPAWLEPLARNAAIPAPPAEPASISSPREFEELSASEPHQPAPVSPIRTTVSKDHAKISTSRASAPAAPVFGRTLIGAAAGAPAKARGGNKGILTTAIAAGIVLAAAGVAWYLRQPSGPVANGEATNSSSPNTPSAMLPAATAPSSTLSSSAPSLNANEGTKENLSPDAKSRSTASGSDVRAVSSSSSDGKLQPAAISERIPQPVAPVDANKALSSSAEDAEPATTRASLGRVRLAKPKVAHSARTSLNGDAAPTLEADSGQLPDNESPLSGGLLAGSTNQPAAPAAPAGGDVAPARLISSVPPAYPALARTQHIAGDVRVDALIGANGRVSSMKVVSGPATLHQAAMDALRQWKYQPATLDGKPVAMHLTVTIQFRLQ